jgi:hypothetical protein
LPARQSTLPEEWANIFKGTGWHVPAAWLLLES